MPTSTQSTPDIPVITREGGVAACHATPDLDERLPWPHGPKVWTDPPSSEPPAELPVAMSPETGGLAVVAIRPLPGRHRKVVPPTVWSRFRVWADQVWAALAEDPTR